MYGSQVMRAIATSSSIRVASNIMRLCVCGSVSRARRPQIKNSGNSTIARICTNRMLLTIAAAGVLAAAFCREIVIAISMINTSGPTTSEAMPALRCRSMRPLSASVACTASNETHEAITAACRCTTNGGIGMVPLMIATERGANPRHRHHNEQPRHARMKQPLRRCSRSADQRWIACVRVHVLSPFTFFA